MDSAVSRNPGIPVSVMIFTLNERINLPACLESLGWCDDVIVIDSLSSDATRELALSAGARVLEHAFTGFGDQRNWALEAATPAYEWVLILDADERVPPDLAAELRRILPSVPGEVGAFRLRRRFYMWGRWLRYSSLYPTWVVRLVRLGRVRYVNRGHAETQEVEGEIRDLENDLIDENLKGMDEWFERQNRYAYKDAAFELQEEAQPVGAGSLLARDPMQRRKALKRLASKMPGRPLLYFLYSYLWRRGFLDGKDGLIFCMMRALYQGMVVARKHDLRRGAKV